ncbi:hypothetical protein Prudu_017419, partial [Prunus dulcis]
DLARAVFGERAIHSMKSFSGSEDIRAAIEAFILKQRELENQHRELRALLLAQDVSPTVLVTFCFGMGSVSATHFEFFPRLNNTLPLSLYNLLEFRLITP